GGARAMTVHRVLLAAAVGAAAAACGPRPGPALPAGSGAVPPDSIVPATVRELIQSSRLVGRRVMVTGRCLGYRVPPVAVGAPPRTRSDWQLEDGGIAIYVTGPLPAGCSATAGSPKVDTLVALVSEDTLPSLAGRPAATRRYLVWAP
ncbi:MAG TPA: hypothetical protein VNK43_11080, partial [Gemmatimonadales bacterium]|nr:hypothetical protein [Gemmatimonadales bacterium]